MQLGLSVGGILGGFLATLIIAGFSWFLEQELGIKHFFRKIYAKLSNSSAEIKVNYNMETNMPFEEIKDKAKNDLSQKFESVSLTSSSKSNIKLEINQRFEIYIRNESSEMISLGTNRVVTTARAIKQDFIDIHSAIDAFTKLGKEQSKETRYFIGLKDVSCYVYISTASSVFNIYKSRALDLESYSFNLVHSDSNFEIKATEGRYQVISDSSSGIEEGISEII